MNPTENRFQKTDFKTVTFCLQGQVAADDFLPWIEAHARKLSVRFNCVEAMPDRLTIRACGPQEMIDALALACSLGPESVSVDVILFIKPDASAVID